MKNNLIDLENEKSLMSFLKEPTVKIAETLTGVFVSEKKDWKLSAGKLIQATIKGSLITQLGREIEKYQEEGRIKVDYFATHKNRASLYELLKFLDEEVPDEELFTAIKSVFFSGIGVDSTEHDEALVYEFLQTAKKLSGTEILILKAAYDISNGRKPNDIVQGALDNARDHRPTWRKCISKQMGYGDLDAVVFKYEENLESLGLISPRVVIDRLQSNYEPTQHFRLTEMGYKFCEFITNYE